MFSHRLRFTFLTLHADGCEMYNGHLDWCGWFDNDEFQAKRMCYAETNPKFLSIHVNDHKFPNAAPRRTQH